MMFKHMIGNSTYILIYFLCSATGLQWHFGHTFHAFLSFFLPIVEMGLYKVNQIL